jgi:putative transposase
MRIREIAQARARFGYRRIRVLLNSEGWDVGKYLVYRLYTEEGLSKRRMKPETEGCEMPQRAAQAHSARRGLSTDFVADHPPKSTTRL